MGRSAGATLPREHEVAGKACRPPRHEHFASALTRNPVNSNGGSGPGAGQSRSLPEVEHESGFDLAGFHFVNGGVDVLELAPLVDDLGLSRSVQLEDLVQIGPGADDRAGTFVPFSTVSKMGS